MSLGLSYGEDERAAAHEERTCFNVEDVVDGNIISGTIVGIAANGGT
jgi:hypothetical protein